MGNINHFLHKVIILDASALIKFFFEEEGTDFVKSLFEHHLLKNLTLMSTPLLTFEFLNVLSKNLKKVDRVNECFSMFLDLGVPLVSPEGCSATNAVQYACEYKDVSFYDASYHALAKKMDGIFVTADKKYYEELKGEGYIYLIN